MIYISKLITPISTGTSAGDIDVGKTVKINENGQAVDYLVVHQGLPSDIYDSSCEGTWCLRKDIAENRAWDSGNSNVLETSDIQAYLNSDWMNRYDPDVAEAIKQVKIPYCVGGGNSTINSGGNGLSCKAFLLAHKELGFFTNPVSDGANLDYFESGETTSAKKKRIATYNGIPSSWYSRTPNTNNTSSVFTTSNVGAYGGCDSNVVSSIRPCIILPYSFKFQEVS